VVSEERGEISLVHHGKMIRELDLNGVRHHLLDLLGLRKFEARYHAKLKEKEEAEDV
jgi:hypothetical protein